MAETVGDVSATDDEKLLEGGTETVDVGNTCKAQFRFPQARRTAENSKESIKDVPDTKQAAFYTPPEWAGIPREANYSLEVLKNGAMVSKRDISGRDHVVLGRSPMADVLVEHPSASRCHAVIQFNGHSGEAFLFDAGSTHGTHLNKRKLKANTYAPLRVGDMFKIGASSRLYIFSGPTDLMPQEGFNRQQRFMMAKLKEAEKQKERDKQVAAAQMQSALSGGASWGFGEDAEEDEVANLSWKSHASKNKLTDNQQKLVDKIRARELKINHMRKECERVEANGRAGDGLTDGQRAVLARNETAIERMTEEMEDFEEDLKDSIRESLSAKAEKAHKKGGKKRRRHNSDDEYDAMNSDEDEYFDRSLATARKKNLASKMAKEPVLTPEILHCKRIDLEERKEQLARALVDEHSKAQPGGVDGGGQRNDDALDSFMSDIQTQLEADKISALETELKEVGSELEEVGRLLRISDPDGFFNPANVKKRKEAETRRQLQEEENKKKKDSEKAAQLLQARQGGSTSLGKNNESMPPPPRPRVVSSETPGAMPPPPPRRLDPSGPTANTPAKTSNIPASLLMPPPPPRPRQQGAPIDANPSPTASNSPRGPESSQGAEGAMLSKEPKMSDSGRLSESDVKAQLEVSEDLRALSQATKRVGDYVEVAEDADWKPPEGQTGDVGRKELAEKMHDPKRYPVDAGLSSTRELKTLRFSGRDGCDDFAGSPQVSGRDGYPSPAPDALMYAMHADWGSPAYAYNPGDVRIDIPEELDETGARTRMMRRRTRKLQYTRRISARINNQRDMIWQENPDRVLSYRPSHLHYYGWIPFFIRRNIKATVFANQKLHLQTLCLLLWVALIHATGLGLDEDDLAGFVKMFNMSFQGAIFNLGTVVIFILGLFISLVINRWWAIRLAYVKLSSNTMDLCMIIANSVRNEWNWNDPSTQRARSELTRLLNLGHLLVITQADGQSKNFKKSKHCKQIINSVIGACAFTWRLVTKCRISDPQLSRSPSSRTWVKKARDINFVDFANEGLVNIDEWNSINDAESKGLPKHLCVYYWAQALIYKCKGADWIVSGQQILPLMLSKISNIVEASAHIFTNISSQMPYPYVHLVSFVVHMYLIALATWYGSFLFVGIDGVENSIDWQADRIDDRHMWNKEATIAWCYALMAVANVTFQGLLDMHSLLDNPFGSHCAKFPLRAQVTDVINTTRTMLTHADVMPAAFRDVFQIQPTTAGSEVSSHDHQFPESGSKFANFLNPPSLHECSFRVDGSRPTSGPSRRSTEKPAMKMSSLQVVRTPAGDLKDTLSQHSAPSGGDYGREKKCVSFSPASPASMNESDLEEEHGPTAASPASRKRENSSAGGAVVQEGGTDKEPILGDDDTTPESVASLCKGVNVHNQLVFGNLQLSRTVSGDPAIQELYLQRVVADAIKSSRGSLGTMGEENTP